jgi:hypothetical protein
MKVSKGGKNREELKKRKKCAFFFIVVLTTWSGSKTWKQQLAYVNNDEQTKHLRFKGLVFET